MTPMRIRGFVALAVASGLLIAACGGSSAKSSATTPPSTAAPSTPQQLAADKALAKSAVLRLADLPAGFKGTPHDDSDDDTPVAELAKFAKCAHVPKDQVAEFLSDADDPKTPSVDGPDLEKDTSDLVQVTYESSVALARSEKDISEPIAVLVAPAALPCWRDFFQAAFAEQAAADHASISPVVVKPLPAAGIGDQAAAFQAKTGITLNGLSVPIFIDFYLARQGRAGISLQGLAIGQDADHTLELSLARKMASRVRAGLETAS